MNLTLPHWPVCAACPRRRSIIQLNRLLGWALLVSPALQWAAGVKFLSGFVFDLGLLLIHSVISLAIYGMPSAEQRQRWKLWVGLRPSGLSPRNEFLLTGWRIFLTVPYSLAAFGGPLFVILGWPAISAVWLWLRLPFTVVGHIVDAVAYAARRWGLRDSGTALGLGIILAIAFHFCTVVNLLR